MPERGLDAYGLVNPQAIVVFYGLDGAEAAFLSPLAMLHVGDLRVDSGGQTLRNQREELVQTGEVDIMLGMRDAG